MTVSNLIREDMKRLEVLNEGPLRNLGMAATVATGLMGSPHAHAQMRTPDQVEMLAPDDATNVQMQAPDQVQARTPASAQDVQAQTPDRVELRTPDAAANVERRTPDPVSLRKIESQVRHMMRKLNDSAILEEWFDYASGIAKVMLKADPR